MTSATAPEQHPDSPGRSRRPAWAGRNYSLLAAAAVVTNLGGNGALIAAAFAVLDTGGDAGDVGLVAAARTLPLVLFLLIGGAVADRLPRHRVMVAANALNCLSQAAFAVLVLAGEPRLWQMMLLTALGGTGQAFFNPAAEGMLMSSVRGEQAGRAFAVFRMAMQSAAVGGAALGGALVAVIGPGWVLAVDAAAFAVAGGLRSFLDVGHIPPREPGGGLLADLREGWREFSGRPWLWGIVAQFSIANAVVGAADAVYGPLVAEEHLGGAGPWGLALGAFGAGTVAGALVMTRYRPRRLLLVGTLCVFPLALPSAALAVPVPVGALYAVMFLTGLSVEVFGVSWMTALHQEIPEDKLSRVSAYDWFGSIAMLPLATALAGPAESALGRPNALWGCAAVIVLVTAAVLCVPEVRTLRRRTPKAPLPRPAAAPGPVPGTVAAPGAEAPVEAPGGGTTAAGTQGARTGTAEGA
ncbi:MFS transporter [Streptomyces griseoaurantiacus]|uniref:MFS transporter n=1 Tax=Streptomyces griseoaurantiacus TaxID=68213 RepID=A0A7W2HUC1_9ACTN|nr:MULTISPECIES: MFS transporter [Streptomyces]MBA5222007.1 MFS transporter [Streptomyces griseoaurantiacus]MCF0086366.1 Multidrug resistance protein MdtH [Streptomyces sp. MH192]MCF0099811.1 Multidrug resistance protein MdtH [Streptomyces sp. MH191]MDX3088351.1 MFS transporter [Streptomyces sp. ME12-02E]MDX3331682.1 MFS transporter [Streptomyces sp. ME02-6978a]